MCSITHRMSAVLKELWIVLNLKLTRAVLPKCAPLKRSDIFLSLTAVHVIPQRICVD